MGSLQVDAVHLVCGPFMHYSNKLPGFVVIWFSSTSCTAPPLRVLDDAVYHPLDPLDPYTTAYNGTQTRSHPQRLREVHLRLVHRHTVRKQDSWTHNPSSTLHTSLIPHSCCRVSIPPPCRRELRGAILFPCLRHLNP